MDGQTITKLAKAHATLITQYAGLSQAEAISLSSQIIQLIAGGSLGTGEAAASSGYQPAPEAQAHSTGSQDAPGEGTVLAKPGYVCQCSSCKSGIYEVTTEIRGKGMGVNSFCSAFKPIGHPVRLDREMLDVLKDANGNTYIDCPVCKGVKTLQLLGKYEATKTGVSPVASVKAGEF